MTALLLAEWRKLRTVRTTWALLGATVAVTALAVAGAVTIGGNAGLDLESERGVRTVLHVSASGGIFVLVLGILLTAGEYRHGTATDTFLTTPARGRVLAAKLVTAVAAGAAFGAASAGVALAVANHAYGWRGASLPLSAGEVGRILAGAVLYAALFGGLGAAVGSLLRNQVAAIVGALAWLFVVEQTVLGLAPSLGRWLPAAAGRALVRDPDGDLLTQPAAAAALALYALAVMVIGVLSERRRDA